MRGRMSKAKLRPTPSPIFNWPLLGMILGGLLFWLAIVLTIVGFFL